MIELANGVWVEEVWKCQGLALRERDVLSSPEHWKAEKVLSHLGPFREKHQQGPETLYTAEPVHQLRLTYKRK